MPEANGFIERICFVMRARLWYIFTVYFYTRFHDKISK